jgi:hypothetical protein
MLRTSWILGFVAVIGGCNATDDSRPSWCEGTPTFREGVAIYGDGGLRTLACITTIGRHGLRIEGTPGGNAADSDTIDLPALKSVEGGLSITRDGLTTINMPALISVKGFIEILGGEDNSLKNINMPVLTTVGGLSIHYAWALTNVEFPELSTVTFSLELSRMISLTSLNLPALASVGGSIDFRNNRALTTFSLPGLMTIDGSLIIQTDRGYENFELTTIEFPQLTTIGKDLHVHPGEGDGHTALTTLALPAIKSVGGNIDISSNPALCQSIVDAILAGLQTNGFDGESEICCNLDGC